MTNLKIMLMGESPKAHTVLGGREAIDWVTNLEDADFVLQDAAQYRAGKYTQDSVPVHELTRREVEVLRMTAEGYSVRQVAAILVLSSKTVDAHKVNLMRKLHIHNKAHLVQYAIRHNILILDGPAEQRTRTEPVSALLN